MEDMPEKEDQEVRTDENPTTGNERARLPFPEQARYTNGRKLMIALGIVAGVFALGMLVGAVLHIFI